MESEHVDSLSEQQLLDKLHTSQAGLETAEAKRRFEQYGPNVLSSSKRRSTLSVFLKQFRSSLIYLLILAAGLSYGLRDLTDGTVITVILVINTGLGFFQEYRSEKAIDKLQKLVSKDVLVKRDGEQTVIPERQLVPGDLVILREGDIVPADIRLVSVDDLMVDESQLTGESVPVGKKSGGKDSLAYAGSTVVEGEGHGYVVATAAQTALGKIAHLSADTQKVTQYEQSLSSFSNFLIKVTFLTLLMIFILKLVLTHDFSHITSLALFMIALSIAVVPEAMPVIATVTLSNGALRLARQHVIVKNLTAVEDMGNITILCSDKTGTLTENRQTVAKLTASDPKLFQWLAVTSLEEHDEKRKQVQSSFDKAFLAYVPHDIQQEASRCVRMEELPFDPAARRRRVVFSDGKKHYLVEIGSVETLLELTKDRRMKKYMEIIKEDGKVGLRHLGIAYKEVKYTTSDEFDILKHEDHLNFVGFVALEDHLRPTAAKTIRLAQSLGVQIKILSGDSREVTHYVASQVGLIGASEIVHTGDELDKLSDDALSRMLEENHAFARLNPTQKYRLIRLLKLHDNVVGYQGDGINDAPSLKLADVAIAVNNATDVAKDSADVLLLHNDLSVIVNGIKEGRAIFSNINKYIRYTMIGNFGNFFALDILYLLSANLPLLAIQLLLSNLLGDIPLLAISTDNVDVRELARPSHYSSRSLLFISMFLGSFTALFELIFFAIVQDYPLPVIQTSLYLYLTILGFVVIFSVRNKEHFWKAPPLSRSLKWSFGIMAAVVIAMTYYHPTQHLFSFTTLSWSMFSLTILITFVYLAFLDIIKVWFYQSRVGATFQRS